MKLSIVIPAHNEEACLGDCLTMVAAELARTSFLVEVIVVSNASTDRTLEVARTFPFVRAVDEPRIGLPRARQTGYEASTGDLIANVDADTHMPAGWIEQVYKEFSADQELVALSGPYTYYDLPPLTNWWVLLFYGFGTAVSSLNALFTGRSGTMLQGGNFVLRRTALEKAGGFDLDFDFYGEDTAIAKRMNTYGKVKFTFQLRMPTSGRRLRTEGIFMTAWKYALNFFWPILFGKPYSKGYRAIRL